MTLITSSIRRFPPDCLDPKIHHCNLIQSILAKIQANVAGADDALMLDLRGFVAETNATHVFLVKPRRGADQHRGGLSGGDHARRRAGAVPAARHPVREKDLSLTEVYRADEMFCTGTMGELAPVLRVDGRTIGAGSPGPVTGRLQELFRECVREEGTPIVG